MQLVQIKRGKSVSLDAANVAAAPLDPQHVFWRTIERIRIDNLRAGISAAEVRDAKIGAQKVRAVTKQLRRIQRVGDALIPPIFQMVQLFLDLHQESLAITKKTAGYLNAEVGTTKPRNHTATAQPPQQLNRSDRNFAFVLTVWLGKTRVAPRVRLPVSWPRDRPFGCGSILLWKGFSLGPNPLLGVFFHWLGGLASGSFYVPFRRVRIWAWETYWLVGGFFSWIIVPWILALWMTSDLIHVLEVAPGQSLFWTYTFGVLWGLGGLTFGLTMRYLGMSLGMAVALGYTAAFGTLMPPIFRGQFATEVLGTNSGLTILAGVGICLLGIVFAGMAGMSKEKEMSEEQKRASIKEFNLKKGLLVATFSGVMSACFAYGLAAGDPIKTITLRHGTPVLWQGLPVLVVLLLGGFTTNFVWCVILNARNRTGYQYFTSKVRGPIPARTDEPILENVTDAPAEEMARACKNRLRPASRRRPCSRTISFLLSPEPPGTFNFSSTPWARPRWAATNSPVGLSTWPAS